jgi:hypothetical protein
VRLHSVLEKNLTDDHTPNGNHIAVMNTWLITYCRPLANSTHGKQQHHQLQLLRQVLLLS